eukprot:2166562-Rhodomonas_salina.2
MLHHFVSAHPRTFAFAGDSKRAYQLFRRAALAGHAEANEVDPCYFSDQTRIPQPLCTMRPTAQTVNPCCASDQTLTPEPVCTMRPSFQPSTLLHCVT